MTQRGKHIGKRQVNLVAESEHFIAAISGKSLITKVRFRILWKIGCNNWSAPAFPA